MVVVERTMTVRQEDADVFAGIFTAECPLESIEGFIRRSVFRKKRDDGTEQFLVYVLFEDEAALQRWSGTEAQAKQRELHKDKFALLLQETKQKVQLVKELLPSK